MKKTLAMISFVLIVVFCGYANLKADDLPDNDRPFVDVFVPGTDGYPAIRIPSIVASKQGTLLAFAEGRKAGDHSENDIVLKRSTDGATWGQLSVLHEAGALSLNNPQAVVLDSGRVLLMYQRNRLGEHKATTGFGPDSYFTFTQHSDDDGVTWSQPKDVSRQVKRDAVTSVASGPGIGIVLQRGEQAGRILMPFNQGPFGDWRVYAAYSDDGGESWKYGQTAPEDGIGHANEVQMVELSDGRVMLNARSQGAGNSKHRKVAISEDAGESWSQVADDAALIEPICQAALLRYSWPDEGKSRILFCNPMSKTSRTNGTLRLSTDEGKTWPIAKTIYPDGFAYCCLARLSDGSVGVLFERDDYKAISFVRIPLEDIEPVTQ